MDAMIDRIVGHTSIGLAEIALRLGMAVILTMVIGWEREVRDKPAGVRTHMLVGVGSAAFYILAYEILVQGFEGQTEVRVDPTRIVQGLIGGIGFLGAGAILQSKDNVQGLTTAAGIWIAGAIGLACGAGFYAVAAMVAAFVFTILLAVGWIQVRVGKKEEGSGKDAE